MRLFFIVFIAASLFVSCEINTPVEVDLPSLDPQPVVICFASPRQPTLAFVGQTTPLLQTPATTDVEVFSFQVMQAGQLLGTLQPTATPGLFQSTGILDFLAGLPYHIEVETAQFGRVVSREVYLPHVTPIDTVFLKDSTLNLAGYYTVAGIFADDPSAQNFYASKARVFDDAGELIDSSANYAHIPSYVFDDVAFHGKGHLYELQVPKRVYNAQTKQVTAAELILYAISTDLFSFLSSINQNEGTLSDVIIEPVPVVSNIRGGHGVFGLYQSDTIRIGF